MFSDFEVFDVGVDSSHSIEVLCTTGDSWGQGAERALLIGSAGLGKSTLLGQLFELGRCFGLVFRRVVLMTKDGRVAVRDCELRETKIFPDVMVARASNLAFQERETTLFLIDDWDSWGQTHVPELREQIQRNQCPFIRYLLVATRRDHRVAFDQCDLYLRLEGLTDSLYPAIQNFFNASTRFERRRTALLCLRRFGVPRDVRRVIVSSAIDREAICTAKVRRLLRQTPWLRQDCYHPLVLKSVCRAVDLDCDRKVDVYEILIQDLCERGVMINDDVRRQCWVEPTDPSDNLLTDLPKTLVAYLAAQYVCNEVVQTGRELIDILGAKGRKSDLFFTFVCGIGGKASLCLDVWFPHSLGGRDHRGILNLAGRMVWLDEGDESLRTFASALWRQNMDLESLLLSACDAGSLACVKLFFSPSVTKEDVVERAAKGGYLEICEWLLRHVEVTASAKSVCAAAGSGFLEVVQFLVETHGAALSVEEPASDGEVALLAATRNGHVDVVKYLLSRGENVNRSAMDGRNGLMIACRYRLLPMVQVFLAAGASVNAGTHANGFTPFLLAAKCAGPEIWQLLLQHGADADATLIDGRNAIALATEQHRGHDMVEVLKSFQIR